MTMSPSAVARARRPDSICAVRGATTAGLLTVLAALSLSAARPVHAETYAGVGVASFSGPDSFDRRSGGLSLHAGWRWRPALAIEAGVIDQRGDIELPVIEQPFGQVKHRWRALHAGLRWSQPFAGRWHASAGLSAAHVDGERDLRVVTTIVDPNTPFLVVTRRSLSHSSWGWLGSVGLGLDLTPSQRLSLDYRHLNAGLKQSCRATAGEPDCRHTRTGIGGVQLSWIYTFR